MPRAAGHKGSWLGWGGVGEEEGRAWQLDLGYTSQIYTFRLFPQHL